MFDIGWTEMLVIAIVMIVVVGPKDLPKMLRTFGRTTSKLRAMAGDFRKQFDEALKEAELDEVKDLASDMRKLNPAADIRKALNPMQKAADDVRAGLDAAMNPAKKSETAPAEPIKGGPTAMPGEPVKVELAAATVPDTTARPDPAALAAPVKSPAASAKATKAKATAKPATPKKAPAKKASTKA